MPARVARMPQLAKAESPNTSTGAPAGVVGSATIRCAPTVASELSARGLGQLHLGRQTRARFDSRRGP